MHELQTYGLNNFKKSNYNNFELFIDQIQHSYNDYYNASFQYILIFCTVNIEDFKMNDA